MNNPVLNIPGPGDKKYGFLNPSSTGYSFMLEGKKWPTVEHYVLAKMFEGTILEEKIRSAKSVTIARTLSMKRNMIVENNDGVTIQNVYGPYSTQKRDGWNHKLSNQYMEAAFKARFDQHSKLKAKLLQTDGFIFNSKDSVGKILSKLRNDIIGMPKNAEKVFFIPIEEDIKGLDHFSSDEEKLITSLIQIITWVSICEGTSPKIFPEMMEDVVCNILGEQNGEKIIKEIEEVSRYVSRDWNNVFKKQPKYEKIISRLRLLDFDSTVGDKIKICIFIATFIKWLRYDSKEMENVMYNAHTKKMDDLFLLPVHRSYRKPFPQKILKEVPKKEINDRGKLYIKLFKENKELAIDKKTYKDIVTILENLSNDKRDIWISKFEKMNMESKKEILKSFLNDKRID